MQKGIKENLSGSQVIYTLFVAAIIHFTNMCTCFYYTFFKSILHFYFLSDLTNCSVYYKFHFNLHSTIVTEEIDVTNRGYDGSPDRYNYL